MNTRTKIFNTLLNSCKIGDFVLAAIILLCVYIPDNFCFSGSVGIKYQILIYYLILTLILRSHNKIRFSPFGINLGVILCALVVFCVTLISTLYSSIVINKDQTLFILYVIPFVQFSVSEYNNNSIQLLLKAFLLSLCLLLLCISKSRTILLASLIEIILFHVLSRKTKKEKFYTVIIFSALLVIFTFFLYKLRPASIIGRCIVWRICFTIISKNWLTGLGYNGFSLNYMLYQRDFFQNNTLPLSVQYLADDITTPYNEFILIFVQFGVIVFIIVTSILLFLLIYIFKKHYKYYILSLSGLVGIFFVSCFSYPFRFPITLLFFILFLILGLSNKEQWGYKSFCGGLRIITTCISCAMIVFMFTLSKKYYYWHKTSIIDTNPIIKSELFNELNHTILKYNTDFLYDYAYWLYQQSLYKDCIHVLENHYSSKNYRNMMFLGEVYYQQSDFYKSIECYRIASQMIPNRFSPLYNIACIYEQLDDERVYMLADSIIAKPVKIQSKEVSYIKDYCIRIINNEK